ncbi:MAG: Fe-S cluster assembly ATPase SufC [Candidatus Woesearchaeota archaeon]|nr:MAG: Fe-S cluster assembly ATPase SufC [Candidatus Woesearchaeota archaeon]
MKPTLEVKNLHVTINDKTVIERLTMTLWQGKLHLLLGPNGSGKSTLAHAIMANPHYGVTGSIFLNGEDITELDVSERAKKGIFLSFQHPTEVEGVSVFQFLRAAATALRGKEQRLLDFKKEVIRAADLLGYDHTFLQRPLNKGMSGGEKKKTELLQMIILKPSLAILDEIDSGLDVDSIKLIARSIEVLREENPQSCILLITHYENLLKYVRADHTHVLKNGLLVKEGDHTLAEQIQKEGFDEKKPDISLG